MEHDTDCASRRTCKIINFSPFGSVSKGEPSLHAQRKIYGPRTALCQDPEDHENTHKVKRSTHWRKKRQRVSYLETPSLIPPHPSTCTQVSDLTLLGYWPFPKVPSIVASPGGPSFFAPSFNKLLLPLFPLPSTDRKAAALGFSDVHHSALNVIHKLKQ